MGIQGNFAETLPMGVRRGPVEAITTLAIAYTISTVYMQNLQPRDRRSLSYIDDSIIIVTLNSAKSNYKKLERMALKLIPKAGEAIISFNINKIELIYFYSKRTTIEEGLKLRDIEISPKPPIR